MFELWCAFVGRYAVELKVPGQGTLCGLIESICHEDGACGKNFIVEVQEDGKRLHVYVDDLAKVVVRTL